MPLVSACKYNPTECRRLTATWEHMAGPRSRVPRLASRGGTFLRGFPVRCCVILAARNCMQVCCAATAAAAAASLRPTAARALWQRQAGGSTQLGDVPDSGSKPSISPLADAAAAAARRRHLAAAAAGRRRQGNSGAVPQSVVDEYNPANGGAGVSTSAGPTRPPRPRPQPPMQRRPGGAPSPPRPRPPPPRPLPRPPIRFSVPQYKQVLGLSLKFYEAQRSGRLPASNRVPWRKSSHLNDFVVGGWYDAGDYVKPAYTIAQSSLFLAWAALDFSSGVAQANQTANALESVKWATDYLLRCSIAPNRFVGLIGDPDVDHDYWGRAEQETGPRKAYIWSRTMPASDLLGMTSAAMASASMLVRPGAPRLANRLLAKAKELYRWGAEVPGCYSDSYPGYSDYLYVSSRYADKLMLAAGWLGRATGNATYFVEAQGWYRKAGGRDDISPYVSWDDASPPAVALLVSMGLKLGAARVPSYNEYVDFLDNTFLSTYVAADGTWGIVKTPGGLRYPKWSSWGNNRYSSNAAFVALLRAAQLRRGHPTRIAAIEFAKSQVDYAMGSAGRSFVVGWGKTPPLRCHHAGASCPNLPATCDWDDFDAPTPNPQVLYGALVAGPAGPGDATYKDVRSDYVTNEVAIDYNSGFTGALAGLIHIFGAPQTG